MKPVLQMVRAIIRFDRVSSRSSMRQRGFSILALALIGLLSSSAIAVPLLNRASNSLNSIDVSAVGASSARAAAEHALWRLQYDSTVHDEFTGTPPTTTYELVFPDGTATITIVGIEPPLDFGLAASTVVTPKEVLPNTPTVLTYTMTISNDDTIPHDIVRVDADPQGSYGPQYVTSSTTGLTTDDPSLVGQKWRWTLATPVTVAPFGGTAQISWQMIIDEGEGNYWMGGAVRFDGVGDIDAPVSANVIAAIPSDIVVSTIVTPGIVESGDFETYTFTITVDNTSVNDYVLTDIKHFTTRDFDFVTGSSTGPTLLDPNRNHDVINDRWEWTWGIEPTALDALTQVVLEFQMTATLTPGTFFSESAVITDDENVNGQEVTAGSGAAAPILAVRIYEVTVVFNGQTISIEALLNADGVSPVSWVES